MLAGAVAVGEAVNTDLRTVADHLDRSVPSRSQTHHLRMKKVVQRFEIV
jgi:hypothetical protein